MVTNLLAETYSDLFWPDGKLNSNITGKPGPQPKGARAGGGLSLLQSVRLINQDGSPDNQGRVEVLGNNDE